MSAGDRIRGAAAEPSLIEHRGTSSIAGPPLAAASPAWDRGSSIQVIAYVGQIGNPAVAFYLAGMRRDYRLRHSIIRSVSMANVEVALAVGVQLGEGPIWDAGRRRLLFVDIMRGDVHAFDPATGSDAVIDIGQPAARRADRARRLDVAARDGFYRADPLTGEIEADGDGRSRCARQSHERRLLRSAGTLLGRHDVDVPAAEAGPCIDSTPTEP